MKRFLVVVGAMALLVGSAFSAKADGIPVKDSGPIPPCGNIIEGSGIYAGGVMQLQVTLASAVCDGVSATASYDLYVILDKPSGALVPNPADPFSFDVGAASEPQLLSSDFVEDDSSGDVILTYEETVLDNDPNICVFAVVHGTVPVTRTETITTTTTDEGDHNGNGNENDDKHKQNEGDNSEGDKHEWDETTTTEERTTTTYEPYVDRAPGTVDSVDPYSCFWLNAISEAYFTVQPGSPSRGFN